MSMFRDRHDFEAIVVEHLRILFSQDVDRYYMAREWLNVIDYASVECMTAEADGDDIKHMDFWDLWYKRRAELLETMMFPKAAIIEADLPELEGFTDALLVALVRSVVEEVKV